VTSLASPRVFGRTAAAGPGQPAGGFPRRPAWSAAWSACGESAPWSGRRAV